MLAAEYGWAKDEILDNVYLVDILFLADEIRRRKVTDYLVHVRISAFPYMKEEDQKKFAEDLMQMGDIFIEEEEVDTKESLNVLRSLMSKGRGFQVK